MSDERKRELERALLADPSDTRAHEALVREEDRLGLRKPELERFAEVLRIHAFRRHVYEQTIQGILDMQIRPAVRPILEADPSTLAYFERLIAESQRQREQMLLNIIMVEEPARPEVNRAIASRETPNQRLDPRRHRHI